MGVAKGDRVAAYLPNVPETVIAILACASVGAIWSSCAPDFGARSAVDRFKQIEPKVLIASYGYSYRGRWNSKAEAVGQIREAIPSIERTVMVGRGDGPSGSRSTAGKTSPVQVRELGFERCPVRPSALDSVLVGDDGAPQADSARARGDPHGAPEDAGSFHNDLGPDDRMFWYTSTGWMMWNYLVGALLLGSTIMLYEGDPFYPDGAQALGPSRTRPG